MRLHLTDRVIFHEGSATLAAYVIEQGNVEIFTRQNGVDTVLQHFGKGDIIGEMALVATTQHRASARAVGEVTLKAITESQLDYLRDILTPRGWATVSALTVRLHRSGGDLQHGLGRLDTMAKVAA
ncbi:MAG: cyclic nucleotide-binding domain-containing protein [Proteobacteria bacterium]|nr:cyclic nucleotide-binding domain-containing protein [Pseudomonadota bacterium]